MTKKSVFSVGSSGSLPTAWSAKQIRDTLEQLGIDIIECHNGAEALALLKEWANEGIKVTERLLMMFTDAEMPEMDGYTLMRQIRALPPEQGGNIKAIALTAFAAQIDYQQAMSAGFQQHIAKPIMPDRLIRRIVSVVDRD